MVVAFLVHPNYALNATFLDDRRLGKQRLEAKQLLQAVTKGTGWKNHPASRSWVGYADSLALYYNAVIDEWERRGKNNSMERWPVDDPEHVAHPPWVSNPRVQYTHMAQLVLKDPTYYNEEVLSKRLDPELMQHFRSLPPEYLNYGYIWPYKFTEDQLQTAPLAEICEPFVVRVVCKHPGCRNKAKYLDLCGVHCDKSIGHVPCQATYKNGEPCRNLSKYGSTRCGVHGGVVTAGEEAYRSASSSSAPPISASSSPATRCTGICKSGGAVSKLSA